VKGIEKTTDRYVVAKLMELNENTEQAVSREIDNLRRLQHERVVTLLAALRPTSSVAVLVMEKLQGANILTYFTSRHEYTEQMVATAVTQVHCLSFYLRRFKVVDFIETYKHLIWSNSSSLVNVTPMFHRNNLKCLSLYLF